MITEPLVLVKSVRCTVDAALETVVRAFENHGFAIVSKLDIYPKSHRLVGDTKRATLLRACFPKARCARYFLSQRDPEIVRCSVLLQENDPASCKIEIARPVRLLDMNQEAVRSLARETDWRLRKILIEFRTLFLPDDSLTADARVEGGLNPDPMDTDPGTSLKISS